MSGFKKVVVCMTESIAVLIPLRGLLSLLLHVYHFFNPCRKSIWLSVDPSHMDCFDVFIPVLVTVIFSGSSSS